MSFKTTAEEGPLGPASGHVLILPPSQASYSDTSLVEPLNPHNRTTHVPPPRQHGVTGRP